MWSEIITFSKDIVDNYLESRKIKKEKLSKVFGDMSDLLMEVSIDLENDVYPHNKCSIMSSLSQDLFKHTKKTLCEKKEEKFQNLLKYCSNIELEFNKRKDPSTITKLREASGEFKALSIILSL